MNDVMQRDVEEIAAAETREAALKMVAGECAADALLNISADDPNFIAVHASITANLHTYREYDLPEITDRDIEILIKEAQARGSEGLPLDTEYLRTALYCLLMEIPTNIARSVESLKKDGWLDAVLTTCRTNVGEVLK